MNKTLKKYLLTLARYEIATKLGLVGGDVPDMGSLSNDDILELKKNKGTFVTLELNGKLRGCIGQILPSNDMGTTIKENAISAAFFDPRFSPLTKEEFKAIQIEISILSVQQSSSLDDVRPKTHGVIIKKGSKSATFLPQVWDELESKKDFMSQLCLKAGLAHDEWGKGTLELKVYTVEHFNDIK